MSAPPDAVEELVGRRSGHAARWGAVAVGAVLLLLVVVLATSKTLDSRGISSELLGEPVPDVQGDTLATGPYDIDQYRGQWVVVNFFATWCTPCRIEHPELVAFEARHRDTGDVQVVSVAFNDQADDIREFFAQNGGSWPVIPEDTNRVALEFGVTGVPESYVVDPNGIVVAKFLDGVTADGLDDVIRGEVDG
jgi:cytochrome c biogenesis protein CcmG/thiol:disulfide interchange protein DsbE